MQKLTIEEMQEIVEERGGKCLSDTYVNDKTKLLWQCVEGHTWEATPSNVKRGTWCPYCAGQHQTISDMHTLARAKGGRCLSKSYITARTKLKWKCSQGHEWEAVPYTIKKHWCPHCSDNHPLSLQEMQILAVKRGGKCISTDYKNVDSPLEWQCAKGHRFKALPDKVKYRNQWCPTCAGRRRTIADLSEWAAKRGGKCLSQKYTGIFEKYEWKCAQEHHWLARASDIKSGTWCPYCSQSIGESLSRYVMEVLFNAKFPKSRPEILQINKTTRLEFDGYSKKLKIAFEYHGRQHFEVVDWFKLSKSDLLKQRDYDKQKCELSRINGITLIEIPHTVPLDELVTFIKARCIKCGLSISDGKKIQISKAPTFRMYHLNEMHAIAYQRGGKCLSDAYVNAKTKMLFECRNGHQWEASPTNLKKGTWCPLCVGKNKTIEDMNEIANKRGGLCLSKNYCNNHTNLEWQCAEGHIWKAIFSNIKRGTWCPVCARQRRRPDSD